MEGRRAGVSSSSLAAGPGLWPCLCTLGPDSLQRHSCMDMSLSGSGKTHSRAGLINTIVCFQDLTVGFPNTLDTVGNILIINILN